MLILHDCLIIQHYRILIDGVKEIWYIGDEVSVMAKLNADKLKNMARSLKDEQSGVKKSGDAAKQSEVKKKISISDSKVSGRKD